MVSKHRYQQYDRRNRPTCLESETLPLDFVSVFLPLSCDSMLRLVNLFISTFLFVQSTCAVAGSSSSSSAVVESESEFIDISELQKLGVNNADIMKLKSR